ncbi:MAG: ComF family protein [Oscillospiraceae bacterium]|nr:ComF family protein [Oscillospiraceae bacterium]
MKMILDLLFPPKCAFCGKLLEKGDLCPNCENSLPFREEKNAVQLIGKNNYRCAVAFYYDGPVEMGIKALKFGKKSWRSKVFARYIAQTAAEQLSGEFDAVTFVPVSLRRNFERGFDQARLLAEETARLWGIRAAPALRKTRHTKAQSSLSDPAQREKNVKAAYAVPRPDRVRGRRFLLIDDVCTTGSTLSAAADALLEAGAAGVVCAVLAGGRRKTEDGGAPLP